MADSRLVDAERATKTTTDKSTRIDIFYHKNCYDCYYRQYCGKRMNCFVCELFKQSRPGSDKGLCVCLNVPTVKEKELGKCKYFKPKEEQTDGTKSV